MVELAVEIHLVIVVGADIARALDKPAQDPHVMLGPALRCHTAGGGLKSDAGLVDVDYFLGAAATHDEAAVAAFDEAVLLKPAECLTDRRPAHLVPRRQRVLDERLSRLELAVDDGPLERFIRGSALRRRGDGPGLAAWAAGGMHHVRPHLVLSTSGKTGRTTLQRLPGSAGTEPARGLPFPARLISGQGRHARLVDIPQYTAVYRTGGSSFPGCCHGEDRHRRSR